MRLHPGEVEATGWRVEPLSEVLQRLDAAAPVAGRPRVIAIDGRGGAGKSVLVERLRALVPASAVVHTDDVAWHQAYFDWGDLMIENILRPLHEGAEVAFRPPAWIARGRAGAIRVPAGCDVVWVEGCGIIRDEFAPWIDASIWIQGDLDEQERRLVARDGESPAQQHLIATWLAEELPLTLRERPWDKATIVVAGTTELDHDPATEIVVGDPPGAMQPLRERLRGLPVFAGALPTFDLGVAPADPVVLFAEWLTAAVDGGVPEPHAMTVATVDADGCPSARVLICKDVDAAGCWYFASSATSRKGRELAANNGAALVFYWPQQGRQVRVRGSVRSAGAAASAADFRARPAGSRAESWVGRQSEPLADPAELDTELATARARVEADPELVAPGWTLYRLTADEVEFWQADAERRHVRLRYERRPDSWRRGRLWP